MAKITANNIFTGAITSDKLDASVASGLATANNANVVATIASTVAAAAFSTANTLSAILANTSTPIITSITIADSSYNALDDTAANTTGGYCIITGSGFVSTPTVVFGTTSAPAVSFVNSTTLRAQIPALTAASYPVYVVNSNGGTAIKINGLTTSSFPAWSTGATLSNQLANSSFSVNLSATSDSSVTYANTTALPAGTTLAANGLFSGTVSVGTQTTYTFDVKATDVENQDATRTFSLTITVQMPAGLWMSGLTSTTAGTVSSPVQIGTNSNWSQLSADRGFVLATKTDGTLWSWGATNNQGQLGQNLVNVGVSSPTQVGADTTWNLISAGRYTAAAIKTNGTLWTWGGNDYGQLGSANLIHRSSPVQVGVATNWSKVSVGHYYMLATKTDGTLWSWGLNSFGALGSGNRISRSSPVQVGTGTSWDLISAGYYNSLATRINGSLWAFGLGSQGQNGLNQVIHRSSPVQVGTDLTWSKIKNGLYHALAIKTNGTLWTWGQNNAGQLGINDIVYRSSPVQVGTETNWSGLAAGLSVSAAVKTDNTLWQWGLGYLGNNTGNNISSPTQVGTSPNWNASDLSFGWDETFIGRTF